MKAKGITSDRKVKCNVKNLLMTFKNIHSFKGDPKKISRSYALGVLLGATPFFGLKLLLAIIIASCLKWNKMVASLGVMIINPLTGPFFHGLAFLTGKYMLGLNQVVQLQPNFNLEYMKMLIIHGNNIMMALLLGGFILGVPMAFIAYHLSMRILKNRKPVRIYKKKPKRNDVYTLITGASNGLGKQMAVECAKKGFNLILVALPGRNLDALCEQLEEQFGIKAVYFETDLTNKTNIEKMVMKIRSKYKVNMLINNAGIGGSICFEDSSMDFIENVIMLNIRAVSMLTRLLIPELRKHKKAYILNVASMAAFCPLPYKSIYPASKAFIYSFSRSLREELKNSGIRVSVVNPGPIMTNPDVMIRIMKHGIFGRLGLLSASKISSIALRSMIKGKSVIIPGIFNKLNVFLIRILPHSIRMVILIPSIKKELDCNPMKMAS